jgi:hypothetical protein
MTIPAQSGYFDSNNGVIRPVSSDTWTAHSGKTWDDWKSWDTPVSTIVWYSSIVDLGQSKSFTLNITTVTTGQASYQIYTSNTGQFAGEETLTTVASGATSVDSFTGQYILVVVTCTYVSTQLTLNNITVTPVVGVVNEIRYKDLDTSTLAGSNTARTVPMSQSVSQIIDVLITPREVTSYALDLYVSSTATSTYVVPKVISKAVTGPVIALVGLDNKPRDATVDIVMKTLPSQKMVGNNLVSG